MATGIQNEIIIEIDVTADATGTNGPTFTLPRAGTIMSAWTLCTATNAGGLLQVERQALGSGVFSAATSAMTCDTANALARPTVIFVSQSSCAATDVFRIVANGAADRGRVYIQFLAPVVP
jgi:hypothetical protein